MSDENLHPHPTRVVVVGTGNVGATFAYALAHSGLAVGNRADRREPHARRRRSDGSESRRALLLALPHLGRRLRRLRRSGRDGDHRRRERRSRARRGSIW